jgi:hypothetical protein
MSGSDVGRKVLEVVVNQKVKCFSVKNFALNKAMIENVQSGFLQLDVVVLQSMNMVRYKEYLAGKMAGKFRVVGIDWHEALDPTMVENGSRLEVVENDVDVVGLQWFTTDVDVMTQMLRENAAHMKQLSVCVHFNVTYKDFGDAGVSTKRVVDFLSALSQCRALESFSVKQRDFKWIDAERHTLQVLILEIVQKMKSLQHFAWNGNMTESRFRLIDLADQSTRDLRCTICDYLPCNLVSFCISDGNEDRANMFVKYEPNYGIFSAFGFLMKNNGIFQPIKILTMPASFWHGNLVTFDFYIQKIDEGILEEIGFVDPFQLYPITSGEWGEFTPGVEKLVTSLTRSMVVNLGQCTYPTQGAKREREDRIEWAKSLFAKYSYKDTGFFRCERVEEAARTTFIFSKRHVDPVHGGRREFEVKVLIGNVKMM